MSQYYCVINSKSDTISAFCFPVKYVFNLANQGTRPKKLYISAKNLTKFRSIKTLWSF